MNFNNFTIKSQEAIQEAVNLVKSSHHAGGDEGRRKRYELHLPKVRYEWTASSGCR